MLKKPDDLETGGPADRPRVTLAWAQSLDGCIARTGGGRLVLSGEEATRMTHVLRSRHDAILVGIGTVIADDPRLDVRYAEGPSPAPMVLDPRLRLPPACRLVGREDQKPWLFAAEKLAPEALERQARLESLGCRVIPVRTNPDGTLNLEAVLSWLKEHAVKTLMVEGGAAVLSSFFAGRHVDRVNITVAPTFVGGKNPFAGQSFSPPVGLKNGEWKAYGRDTVITGEPDWERRVSGR